jgi:16S rRNA (guanine527-N7)-methyltransferase
VLRTDQIAALLQPFLTQPLPEVALQQISTYINLLLRWNGRINLTAIRDPEAIVTRHFGESLFLARHLFPVERRAPPPVPDPSMERTLLSESSSPPPNKGEARVLDIGSGAGFPGLPLKIWAPEISLTLVESNHKKAAFLREVIRTITLTDVNVITARAETLPGTVPPADVVTLRAVERFDAILSTAARLLAPTGRLALLIGSSQLPDLACLAPNLRWSPPISVPQSLSRVVSIGIPS